MANKLKDSHLEEKEQLIVEGTILADEFRDRKTGKLIGAGGSSEGSVAIHNFAEGTILTEEILSKVKSGDILKVNNMEFVVNNKTNQTPRSITGKMIGAVSESTITIIELDWVIGEELEPTITQVSGGGVDTDVSVHISTDSGSTWGDAISWSELWTKCHNKQYTVGTMMKIVNFYKGFDIRFIATDLTHGSGTEWQFYDMITPYVHLGLPFDAQDFGDGGAAGLQGYLDGEDTYIYPSNKHGYTSAVNLQNTLLALFNNAPHEFKRLVNLTPIDCDILRTCVTDDYSELKDYSVADWIQYEGPDSLDYGKTYQHFYCLSASEMGYQGNEFPTTVEWNDGEEVTDVYLEGEKHDYFEYGNEEQSALSKRIRYYNGNAHWYWLRSPYLPNSYSWGIVYNGGYASDGYTYICSGVAPAFRIG